MGLSLGIRPSNPGDSKGSRSFVLSLGRPMNSASSWNKIFTKMRLERERGRGGERQRERRGRGKERERERAVSLVDGDEVNC